ncbi:hypothetical protein ACTQ6A_05335 [Lachnospiraceae bacterium LCP25S3_G4]
MATKRQEYIYGNTVRQPEVTPRRREEVRPRQPKRVSKQVRKNRKKAMHMSVGYLVFLSVAAVVALFVCVSYLQLQSQIAERSRNISSLQKQLASAKEENTTMYNAIDDSVNLEEVLNRAVNELGMVYATSSQVIEYESPSSDYVKQYQNIPKNGVLAQSNVETK